MTRIRRLGVISVANVSAAIVFVISLFFVVLVALVALPLANSAGGLTQFGIPAGSGVMVLVIAPFLYAALGWISGAISALVYNLVARLTGGIRLELDGLPPTRSDSISASAGAPLEPGGRPPDGP